MPVTAQKYPHGRNIKSQHAQGSETLPNKVLLRRSGEVQPVQAVTLGGEIRKKPYEVKQRNRLTLRGREGQSALVCWE